ncbi:uncharacterized protein [Dysidea avara]|uniref:uncharacterized protein isoform X2 n=1 Tax=Dysidea avara TaxID=196820 RepID=UPI00331C0782
MVFKMIVVLIWCITLFQYTIQSPLSQEYERVIIVDKEGCDTPECCAYGQHSCSSLSNALALVIPNTEIRIMSNITFLLYIRRNFENIAITGYNNPIVKCDHLGGIFSYNSVGVTIQNITWDKCRGFGFCFANVNINNCTFRLFKESVIRIVIFDSTCGYYDDRYPKKPEINITRSLFYYNTDSISIQSFSIGYHITLNNSQCIGDKGEWIFTYGAGNVVRIISSNFTNNSEPINMLEGDLVLEGEVTFNGNFYPITINSQGNINISGHVVFKNNLNTNDNGGAIYLSESKLFMNKSTVLFYDNVADNGGAIFVDPGSTIYVNQTTLEFVGNTALSYGGAVYVDLSNNYYVICNSSNPYTLLHFYNILVNASVHDHNSAAKGGDYVYFDLPQDYPCNHSIPFGKKEISSSVYHLHFLGDVEVSVSQSNYYKNGTLLLWPDDLQFQVVAVDYFHNSIGPVNGSLSCDDHNDLQCYNYYSSLCWRRNDHFNYTFDIDVTVISNNSGACCCVYYKPISLHLTINVGGVVDLRSAVIKWRQLENHCYDIMHYRDANGICKQLSCDARLPAPGMSCPNGYLVVVPGYWYEDGFYHYVISCPSGFCDPDKWINSIPFQPFPSEDSQCSPYWTGFSCGECKYELGHAIQYGTTNCVSYSSCLTSSVRSSLMIFLSASFLYWCLIIIFVFVLLHFQLDTGYVFGLIFYYGVLEQVVSVYNEVVQAVVCDVSANDNKDNYYYDPNNIHAYYGCVGELFDFSAILPLFSSLGNLKPPFMSYLHLCFRGFDILDHLFIVYFHPVVVTFMIVVISIATRYSVRVARTIGRVVNSKSVCLLLLLSYNSFSCTSVQLLRPLPYFTNAKHPDENLMGSSWKAYWSPAVTYYHHRHGFYASVAILLELIVGLGFPVALILRQYTNCNTNLMSIKPIVDQLQGCYKDECYWFAAYYLMCRQVIFGIDPLFDVFRAVFSFGDDSISTKLILLLLVLSVILVVHLWFQPYRRKGLNVLDTAILMSLIVLLVSSLDGRSYNIAVVFWLLPIIFFINYLSFSTKYRHLVALLSICVVIALINALTFARFYYFDILYMLSVLVSFTVLVTYLSFLCKRVYYKRRAAGHMEINDVGVNENGDNDSD